MKPSVWRVVWCRAIGLKTHWHAREADGSLSHCSDFEAAIHAAVSSHHRDHVLPNSGAST